MSAPNHAVSAHPSRRGRKAAPPPNELAACIQKHLDTLGLTRAELAKRLNVSPSTIGRLLNGDTRVVQRVSAERICEVLGLDEMERRAFLKLAGEVSAASFAMATGTLFPKVLDQTMNLEFADSHIDALQRLLNKGEAVYVLESAKFWYNKLLQEYPDTKDARIATAQMRFGMLLGSAQIFVLPWYQRSGKAIRTFNHIEGHIICRFDLHGPFRHMHAQLIGHRAPLYRELKLFEESIKQFDDGLSYIEGIDDEMLHTSLMRNRAHIMAILGDELHWAREIETAARYAQRLHRMQSENFISMVINMQSEGYRRLAFSLRTDCSLPTREKYAKLALEGFQRSGEVSERLGFRYREVARRLVVQVSEAQCLVWLDPHESIRKAEALRSLGLQFYPTILDKIDRVLFFAHQRLQMRRSNFSLLFNLDARKDEPLIYY